MQVFSIENEGKKSKKNKDKTLFTFELQLRNT